MLVQKIHHVAYRCKDAKETVDWYVKHLDMKFVLAIAENEVPSTKAPDPYMHVFLDAGDGNVLAFFELPSQPPMDRDRNTPAWVQHLALKVDSMDTLLATKARLEAAGIEVVGPTDHTIFKSIYFFDPNGHRLELCADVGTPALYRKLGYKTLEDFEYLGMVNDVPMTLIARPNIPANNMKELTGWIAQNKGKINLGNAGLGAASHLCGLMFQNAMQVEMTTVPYKGTAPAITDLIGGQIDLLCDQTTNTTSQIEGKKVKAFAVTTSKRLKTPALKDLPTLAESGLKNFEVTIWHGLYAPKGTPAAIVTKINDALKLALKDPEFIKKQEGLGAVVVTDKRIEPAEHKKFVQAEIDKWGAVIKAAGTYAD